MSKKVSTRAYLSCTDEEFDFIMRAVRQTGKSMRAFASEAVVDAAADVLGEPRPLHDQTVNLTALDADKRAAIEKILRGVL